MADAANPRQGRGSDIKAGDEGPQRDAKAGKFGGDDDFQQAMAKLKYVMEPRAAIEARYRQKNPLKRDLLELNGKPNKLVREHPRHQFAKSGNFSEMYTYTSWSRRKKKPNGPANDRLKKLAKEKRLADKSSGKRARMMEIVKGVRGGTANKENNGADVDDAEDVEEEDEEDEASKPEKVVERDPTLGGAIAKFWPNDGPIQYCSDDAYKLTTCVENGPAYLRHVERENQRRKVMLAPLQGRAAAFPGTIATGGDDIFKDYYLIKAQESLTEAADEYDTAKKEQQADEERRRQEQQRMEEKQEKRAARFEKRQRRLEQKKASGVKTQQQAAVIPKASTAEETPQAASGGGMRRRMSNAFMNLGPAAKQKDANETAVAAGGSRGSPGDGASGPGITPGPKRGLLSRFFSMFRRQPQEGTGGEGGHTEGDAGRESAADDGGGKPVTPGKANEEQGAETVVTAITPQKKVKVEMMSPGIISPMSPGIVDPLADTPSKRKRKSKKKKPDTPNEEAPNASKIETLEDAGGSSNGKGGRNDAKAVNGGPQGAVAPAKEADDATNAGKKKKKKKKKKGDDTTAAASDMAAAASGNGGGSSGGMRRRMSSAFVNLGNAASQPGSLSDLNRNLNRRMSASSSGGENVMKRARRMSTSVAVGAMSIHQDTKRAYKKHKDNVRELGPGDLTGAAADGDLKTVTRALGQYPVPVRIESTDSEGKTALYLAFEQALATDEAARNGEVRLLGPEFEKVVEFLVAKKANINAKREDPESDGWSLVHHVCVSGSVERLLFLIRHGASVGARTKMGETPLMKAAAAGNVPMVLLLLKSRCELNARDARGMTALHHAAARGGPDVTRFLLTAGAIKAVTDDGGFTPAELAKRGKRRQTAEIIMLYKHKPESIREKLEFLEPLVQDFMSADQNK